mmetsp:Transcript_53602/g.123224  ORF Transcript_53602/g.123224 Transcript_53602/m.123224 type:complete len:305 (+) Transcript_53602:599-1513(+)
MACRTRQFLSDAKLLMSRSNDSCSLSSDKPTTPMKLSKQLMTASRTFVFSSSVRSGMTGSSSVNAASLPMGLARFISTVASSTRLAALGSLARPLTTGKMVSLLNSAPSDSATPAALSAAATRTSGSWSNWRDSYKPCSDEAHSGEPEHTLATSEITSAQAMRTRHDLSCTHFLKSFSNNSRCVGAEMREQTDAQPRSALTRTDSCSSASSVRCSGSRSSSMRAAESSFANSDRRIAAARLTMGESSMPSDLQNVSLSSLPCAVSFTPSTLALYARANKPHAETRGVNQSDVRASLSTVGTRWP